MILEKGCAERGCACYDVRVDEGVEVKVVRELTDEEITEIGLAHGAFFTESKHRLWGDDLEIHDFARAILKKASEVVTNPTKS
jgi:hypothetical protein